MRMRKPIHISGNKVIALLDPEYSLKTIGVMEVSKYYHKKSMIVYSLGKAKHVKKGSPKSRSACFIIELKKEFYPVCCEYDEYNPEDNPPLYMPDGSTSVKDIVYKWNFVHRHGFPSDLNGSGRGQGDKAYDIFNHPLSYMLMCNEHHEEYDRENGEWKNPKNRGKYKSDS